MRAQLPFLIGAVVLLVAAQTTGARGRAIVSTSPRTPPPSPPAATPSLDRFAPPDLVNLSFNDPADDARIRWRDRGAYQTMDATGGRNGSRAIRIAVNPGSNDGFGPIGPTWSSRGRVFLRWYFRTQGTPSGNVKGLRFHADFSNLGEVYGGSPCWSFDWEPSDAIGACVFAGMSYGTESGATCRDMADGKWHWIEVDYNRNDGPNVSVRLWCDGKAVVMPAGPTSYFGAPIAASWSGGSAATGTPSTLSATRTNRDYVTGVMIWPMISQARGSALVWVDDLAASTERIGP